MRGRRSGRYGLRNPWQFSFDRETGDLYIDRRRPESPGKRSTSRPPGTRGGQNYGWDCLEGTHCYPEDLTDCPRAADWECSRWRSTTIRSGTARSPAWASTAVTAPRRSTASTSTATSAPAGSGACSATMAGPWVYQELLDTAAGHRGGKGEAGEVYLTSCHCGFARTYDPFANPQGAVWRLVAAGQGSAGAATPTPDAGRDDTSRVNGGRVAGGRHRCPRRTSTPAAVPRGSKTATLPAPAAPVTGSDPYRSSGHACEAVDNLTANPNACAMSIAAQHTRTSPGDAFSNHAVCPCIRLFYRGVSWIDVEIGPGDKIPSGGGHQRASGDVRVHLRRAGSRRGREW